VVLFTVCLFGAMGCGASETEVRQKIAEETAALKEQIEQLEQANTQKRERLKAALCESICLDLKQLKSIEENIPPAAEAEYRSVLQSLRAKFEALGCPPCEE